jgi:hypothetical protein
MHLALRYAASIPLLLAIVVALASPLLKHLGWLPSGRAEIPMYALLMMGPIVALLFVIPNVAAAFLANRYGHTMVAFIGIFLLAMTAVWVVQARFLNRLFETMGGTDLLDPKGWWMIALDLTACLGAAALIREPVVG